MPLYTILVALAVLAAAGLVRFAWAWHKYRGNRVITCPENHSHAGVRVNAGHAAATALVRNPELRLSACTRWPERQNCGQACLSQIQAAPEDCLVRNVFVRWYQGKTCVSCGQGFADIEWSRKPALLRADGLSMEWEQIPADQIFETLEAAAPLCFGCHMARTLVREHPDLAINRPGH